MNDGTIFIILHVYQTEIGDWRDNFKYNNATINSNY